MRVLRSILLAAFLLSATPRSARAQPRPLSASERALTIQPQGLGQTVIRGFLALQDRQRRGPAPHLNVPPVEAGGASRPWLPEVQITLLPSGMAIGPLPYRPIDAAPVIAESANTIVASARGNDGMLVALTIGLPWRAP